MKKIKCPHCNGTGKEDISNAASFLKYTSIINYLTFSEKDCTHCNGTGQIESKE